MKKCKLVFQLVDTLLPCEAAQFAWLCDHEIPQIHLAGLQTNSIHSWQNQSVSRETERERDEEEDGLKWKRRPADRSVAEHLIKINHRKGRTEQRDQRNSTDDSTERKLKTGLKLMRGWGAGAGTQVRGIRRKAADWLGRTPGTEPGERRRCRAGVDGENSDLSAYIPAGMSEYLYKLLAFNF